MFGNIDSFNQPIVDLSAMKISDFGDALVFGGSVLALGMLTVFSVLCILWLFIFLFRLAFHDLPKKIKKRKKVAPVLTTVQNVYETAQTDDKEIIAVIAAAIAMAESEGSGMNFKVVSFKRI